MFQELGPGAREVLEAVAFFPQGVNEDNAHGLFPTISDGPNMFDTFCDLSLTHRDDGFITILASLRDHLRPEDPMASPFLRTAKEHYFGRLSVDIGPGEPGFDESKWITSEDVNVEHLLDFLTSIGAESENVWAVCIRFMDYLYRHKPRLVILGSKAEALPDGHPSKPHSLLFLSRLFDRIGNSAEEKRILIHSLGLWRKRGDELWVAETLIRLADVNQKMGSREEVIHQASEASEIFRQLGEKGQQAYCLMILALSLCEDNQLDAAEETASRALDLSENQIQFYQSHDLLGEIHQSKGNTEKAIHHFEISLRIAFSLGSGNLLSETHIALAHLYAEEGKFTDAHAHVEHAKSHAGNDMILLGRVIRTSACVLYVQRRFEEAKLEASHALSVFEKIGAAEPAKMTREFFEMIEVNL